MQAARDLKLDEIRFIPARLQPLKVRGPQATANDRVAMLRAAIAGHPGFVLDLRELQRAGPSYTVDTLRALRLEKPRDELFLIVGADAARELPSWHEADKIRRLATVVVAPRPGVPLGALPPSTVTLTLDPINVSATYVRDAAQEGRPLDHLVPKAVADYIEAHRLYRTGL